jgi:hypothetical protein
MAGDKKRELTIKVAGRDNHSLEPKGSGNNLLFKKFLIKVRDGGHEIP